MTIADKMRQEGRVEGLRTALQLQLEAAFGPLSPTTAARLLAADETDLEHWLRRILTSDSVGKVFD